MSTLVIPIEHTAAKNVYVVLQKPSNGQVFDFSDDTFKAVGSATTPGLAATSVGPAGVGRAVYSASVDLVDVHNNAASLALLVQAYERAGASPVPATDTLIAADLIEVRFGREASAYDRVTPQIGVTIDGSDCFLQAWLEYNGETLDLDTIDPDATCSIEVWEQDAAARLFQVDDADHADFALSASAANHFALQKASVFSEEHAGKNFFVSIVITVNGNSFAAEFPIAIHGGI